MTRSLFFNHNCFLLPDFNECEQPGDNECDQMCENLLGTYECNCSAGYVLYAGRKCIGKYSVKSCHCGSIFYSYLSICDCSDEIPPLMAVLHFVVYNNSCKLTVMLYNI